MICDICGKEIEKSYYSCGNICSHECFHKYYWGVHIKNKNDKRSVRCNGTHYVIGDENSKSSFRGFDGRRFKICFFDGRVVETTNLWCQGDIPEEFRKELKDNAVVISK